MWPCRFSNMITCTEMVQTPILELVTCCPFDPLSPRGPCLPLAASANSVLRGNDNAWIELNIQLLQVEPARYHVARLLWCCGNLELLAEIFWFYDTTVSESWHPFFSIPSWHPDPFSSLPNSKDNDDTWINKINFSPFKTGKNRLHGEALPFPSQQVTVRGPHVTPLEADTCDDGRFPRGTFNGWNMGHWRSVNWGKTDEDGWRWLDSAVYEVVSHLKKPQIIPPRHRKNTDFGGKGSRTPFFMTLYDYMMHEAPLIFQATIFFETSSDQVLKCPEDFRWPEVWQFEFRDSIHM